MRLFEITEISDGWFEAKIFGEYELMCSDLWLADSPKNLLTALCDICISDCEKYISFKGEPGADILELIPKGEKVKINVYDSLSYSDSMLPNVGSDLKKYRGNLLYFNTVSKSELIGAVLSEFERYSDGEQNSIYVKNWDLFPHEEYDKLKSLIEFSEE